MQSAERFATLHSVPDSFVKFQAHGGVNRVFLLFAPATQHHASHAQLLALRLEDVAVGWAGDIECLPRMLPGDADRLRRRTSPPCKPYNFAEFLAGLA